MRREKVQKGNPHRLTIYQHIFPATSINRFADGGLVQVKPQAGGEILSLVPKNPYFCGNRLWDHKTEHTLLYDMETAFQNVADQIISNPSSFELSHHQHSAITDFYILWNARHKQLISPIPDQEIKGMGISLERDIDKDSQERLEKNGVMFIRPDLIYPGQFIGGIRLFSDLNFNRERMREVRWGIVEAENGEFIVPDNSPNVTAIPITPKLCLVGGLKNILVNFHDVAKINRHLINGVARYYFARSLKECPILKNNPIADVF